MISLFLPSQREGVTLAMPYFILFPLSNLMIGTLPRYCFEPPFRSNWTLHPFALATTNVRVCRGWSR